jgi:hypothetical protein
MSSFSSVTVFLLASNETELLSETVERILSSCCEKDISKIVIALKSDNCPSAGETDKIIARYSEKIIEKYIQKSDSLIRCIAELPLLVDSSHFIIMGSDLEMNPDTVKDLISEAKKYPDSIVSASKWADGSETFGYGFIRGICDKAVNRFIGLLYGVHGSDFFSIFQIYPFELYKKMNFDDPDKFIFEYTLKPLKLGTQYFEIPTVYRRRNKDKSNFNFFVLVGVAFRYLKIAIKIKVKGS